MIDGEFEIACIMTRDLIARKAAVRKMEKELGIFWDRERGGWIRIAAR